MLHACPTCAARDAVPAEPSPEARRAAARGVLEGQMALLARLAAVGMTMAEDAGRAITTTGEVKPLASLVGVIGEETGVAVFELLLL